MPLNTNEWAWLSNMLNGEACYPVRKVGRVWVWEEAFGVAGSGAVYKRKADAVQAVRAYTKVLLERNRNS